MQDTIPEQISETLTATSASGGAVYLVFAQVVSRAFTFLGNQFLLRYLSPSLLGLAVQLELLTVTILYFARESLRVTLQREPPAAGRTSTKTGDKSLTQQIVNLAYLVVVIGLTSALLLGGAYLVGASDEVLNSRDFQVALKLYAAATLAELLSEPFFLIIQQRALYQVRARAETTASIARCTIASLVAIVMHRQNLTVSVLPFAVGQLAYGISLFLTYLLAVHRVRKTEHFSLLPRRIEEIAKDVRSPGLILGLFSRSLLLLTLTFYAQSIFKLLLTQGDNLILSFLTDLRTQGAFALASNYAGLLSRLIFQPIEESSRNIFGQLLTLEKQIHAKQNATGPDVTRDGALSALASQTDVVYKDLQEPKIKASSKTRAAATSSASALAHGDASRIDEVSTTSDAAPSTSSVVNPPLDRAISHLTTTLHIYTLFALPLLSILPPLITPLTNLILPAQWRTTTEPILLFQAYVNYIPFIAVNGLLDAFVTSVATPSELRTQSLLMAGISIVYGGVAWMLLGQSAKAAHMRRILLTLLTLPNHFVRGAGMTSDVPWGSPGLVYANIVNMTLRITYSMLYISRWVDQRTVGSLTIGRGSKMQQMWRESIPHTSCIIIACVVSITLRITLHDIGADDAAEKTFYGIKGLSIEDVGYIIGGLVALGSTM